MTSVLAYARTLLRRRPLQTQQAEPVSPDESWPEAPVGAMDDSVRLGSRRDRGPARPARRRDPPLRHDGAGHGDTNEGSPLLDEVLQAVAREYSSPGYFREDTTVAVAADTLAACVGSCAAKAFECEVARDGDRLLLRLTKQPALEPSPTGEELFGRSRWTPRSSSAGSKEPHVDPGLPGNDRRKGAVIRV